MASDPAHIISTEIIIEFLRPYLSATKPKDIAADRPHQKADREHRCGLQKLSGLIALWKERRRKIAAP